MLKILDYKKRHKNFAATYENGKQNAEQFRNVEVTTGNSPVGSTLTEDNISYMTSNRQIVSYCTSNTSATFSLHQEKNLYKSIWKQAPNDPLQVQVYTVNWSKITLLLLFPCKQTLELESSFFKDHFLHKFWSSTI